MKDLILFCTSEKYQKIMNDFDARTDVLRTIVLDEPVIGVSTAILNILNSDVNPELKQLIATAFEKYNCKIVKTTSETSNHEPHIQLEVSLKSFPKDVCKKIIAINREITNQTTNNTKR